MKKILSCIGLLGLMGCTVPQVIEGLNKGILNNNLGSIHFHQSQEGIPVNARVTKIIKDNQHRTWVIANQEVYKSDGYPDSVFTKVNFSPDPDSTPACLFAKGDTIYIGSANYIFWSTNGGTSWLKSHIGFPKDAGVTAISVDNNGVVWAGVMSLQTSDVYKSTDGGKSFTLVPMGTQPYSRMIQSITVDKKNNNIWVGLGKHLYVSKDEGNTWSKIPYIPSLGTYINTIYIDGQDNIWVGNNVLSESTDGGVTFKLNNSIPSSGQRIMNIFGDQWGDIAVSGATGLYWSIDYGASFESLNHNGLPSTGGIACSYFDSWGTFWVGTPNNGLFVGS